MNWAKFLTYGDSQQNAFETLCNQLFERYLKRTYDKTLTKFKVINGAGGDGGIEAYGQLNSGSVIAVQSKWFRNVLKDSEIGQIRKSITTAKDLRPEIKEYIICVPHDVSSLKYGRGKSGGDKKPIDNFEEKTIDDFTNEITTKYADLKITWWFEKDLELELQQANNEGVQKFWFDKEVISLDYLAKHFKLQKRGWLHERYIPELHGQGIIHEEYQKLCFSMQYRNELLSETTKTIADLKFCITQIENFIPTNTTIEINDELTLIRESLTKFSGEFQKIASAVKTGNDFYKPLILSEVDLWETKWKLEKLDANNSQKNILPRLISSLDNIHKYNLPQHIQHFAFSFNQKIRLIIGEPGTGKTHGLTNCVEIHLAQNSPSIIIQAKGTPFKDWTEILSKSFGIQNWSADEILSALETLATKNDVRKATTLKAGEEYDGEITKAIICIDGLEEEIENEKDWYARIRECEQLTVEYPRVRFIFSARRYFYNNQEVPLRGIFEEIFLPREGDVSIDEVAPHYFNKDHYNIQLSSLSLIRGIDSLFALRLFCEEYKNRSITVTDKIVTATRGLINIKIDRLNKEFISKLQGKKGATRNPIMDSLEIIANFFYKHHEVEHNQLVELISPALKNYLDGSEIDSLIDYLADNAFLIRFERVDNDGVLEKRKHYYNITYQSLIEHIISEKIYYEIKSGSLNRIPQFLHEVMGRPFDFNSKKSFSPFEVSPNEKIIQNIITNSLIENGRLIGENNFLTEGFDEWEIKKYQLTAISKAPAPIAQNFKAKIDELFNGGYTNLSYVLEYLVLPSSYSSDSVFGAEYLHQTLKNLSVFERDKIWSGLDMHETDMLNELERHRYQYETNRIVFRELGLGKTFLFEGVLHNERPLIFAWGLSSIDQELRNDLRVSLTGWAIKNPSEFLLLLKKIFNCNDPQMQEDLAAIMLGVASRLKDKERVKELALWSIENVFKHLDFHRNIIVRQGFRAIVERAFQYVVISKEEVEECRPRPMKNFTLLPLETNLETTGHDGCYPIVHDLAWYVIGESYSDFLEYPSSMEDNLIDNDCPEAKSLLDKYREAHDSPDLFGSNWALSAAIAYIRGLGFNRTEGNRYTQATHGTKSKIFTYEEKYTWLAVHYIQGYLADYIPVKRWSDHREFITDYFSLTDIPNPAESVFDLDITSKKLNTPKDWIIKEVLTREFETGATINKDIANWVNEEPVFDLDNWLSFDSTDFQIEEPNRKWMALYNHTNLHDSKEYCYSYIDLKACLLNKADLPALIRIIQNNPDSLRFTTRLEGLRASPRTDTYSNPTDIVWMTWIEEDGSEEILYNSNSDEEKYLHNTITRIVQNKIDGEDYLMLPSKKIRGLIGCYELLGDELKDANEETLAFNYKKSDGSYKDNQELLLVDRVVFETIADREGYEMVWFIELFRQRNPLNKILDENFHIRKTRKYFVWTENYKKQIFKFWDEDASNIRDKEAGLM
jgi:hypothetical protein